MVGLVKSALNKTVGNSLLTWAELEEILLDVEVKLNNRPLSYADEDVQLPLLTPNSLMSAQPNKLPELQSQYSEDLDLRKRAREDVVIIKSEEKNREQWKLGIIEELITGQDGVVRGNKLREGKSILERPVQLLYPVELTNERPPRRPNVDLDPRAPAFRPAFRRNAAAVARVCIQDIAQDEQ
ncbi:uncharacterized protein [Montipora capricornis]|uniref:uncharacterized protein n=1 Tax=Montipora capricornis TaxID=246305 RepID=UPI0035F123E8